ncbi:gliding motility lipoprotein GldD [Fulvivirga ligni]|uniref:gliding motility lipoprotein GldD n=1 Tax=Fulvivirga ligni TaxID=2904246 RepID=UPI001F24465F|nr:gliding motility lipoprotein GldD [Fulvivirga ligni]UII22106.1 gliding motility lipoprotein GldD [Fulvivirga ligni]
MKRKVRRLNSLFVVVFVVLIIGCSSDYAPKPKGYNRFVLPPHEYQALPDTFPYSFEYSKHARLLRDSSWISDRFWVEIYYPQFKADINITYKVVDNQDSLKGYLDDAYFLTAKHQIKASGIDETIAKTATGKTVVYAELDGEVPSQFQFFTTDSTKNFFRGALYFDTKVHNDSLMPAIEYVKIDIVKMMNSFTWNDKVEVK